MQEQAVRENNSRRTGGCRLHANSNDCGTRTSAMNHSVRGQGPADVVRSLARERSHYSRRAKTEQSGRLRPRREPLVGSAGSRFSRQRSCAVAEGAQSATESLARRAPGAPRDAPQSHLHPSHSPGRRVDRCRAESRTSVRAVLEPGDDLRPGRTDRDRGRAVNRAQLSRDGSSGPNPTTERCRERNAWRGSHRNLHRLSGPTTDFPLRRGSSPSERGGLSQHDTSGRLEDGLAGTAQTRSCLKLIDAPPQSQAIFCELRGHSTLSGIPTRRAGRPDPHSFSRDNRPSRVTLRIPQTRQNSCPFPNRNNRYPTAHRGSSGCQYSYVMDRKRSRTDLRRSTCVTVRQPPTAWTSHPSRSVAPVLVRSRVVGTGRRRVT